jgi:S1-C subfamily serine protease
MKILLAFCLFYGAMMIRADEPVADPVVRAIQKVLPAVVNISTEHLLRRQFHDPFEEFFRQFFGQPRPPEAEGSQSLGSGVIVDEDGWIVTNYHVTRRANKIHVVLTDGSQYAARYVSGDEKNDLALLKIDAKKPLPFVDIASDQEPLLGETVIAVGNPFGLEQTVTRGIISAKRRKYAAGDVTFDDVLQTDAAINPGNSGGPLVNTSGRLVGINMAILSHAEGIGFAIPAKRVAALVSTWLTPEKRSHVWLGLSFVREAAGLLIGDVQAGSPAAKAGLAVRDRLLAVDGESFTDILALERHLLRKKAGDVVRFECERAGKRRRVDVTLTALPVVSAPELMLKRFGLHVQELTPELSEALGIRALRGLLVSDVERNSPGARAGFVRGMVITHVGGEEIESLDRLAEQLATIKPGDGVSMAVFISERRGNITFQRTTGVTLQAR